MRNDGIVPGLWLLAAWLTVLAPSALQAGSLEFRSEGFFASPGARVKLVREPWRYTPHLDVDGALAVDIVGPILQPGYIVLSGEGTKTETDVGRRQLAESGVLGGFSAPCRRTVSEYAGGILVRMEYGQTPPEVTEAICRVILPIGVFRNRRARWRGGEMVLPDEKPDAQHLVFLNDPKGNLFRFDLGNGLELGLKLLSPAKALAFADCRQWNEMNYHLQATFDGQEMLLFACLLKPDEPFPQVEAPTAPGRPREARASAQGAVLQAGDGLYEVLVARSGQAQVMGGGVALFGIEAPYVREGEAIYPLTEQVGFQVSGSRVEVVTKAKDRPLGLRQSFAVDEDGWLNVSAEFEGLDAARHDARAELALPVAQFLGNTVRAGDRFVDLPRETASRAILLDDWAGKVLDYDLRPNGPDHLTLVCDRRRTSYLSDPRQWGQDSFKIGMTPRDGAVEYRLHFWKEDGPPAVPAKGNLLRDGASFETGPDGVRPFSCYSWTEKMVEPGIRPAFDATTAVHGQVSLRLGAEDSVKKGDPRGFAFVGAVFNRVALKRDRRYTVSAYMKADRPGMEAVLYCGETTWAGNDWGAFPVSTEWQRYQFPFFTNDFRKTGYYLTWAGISPECKEGTLWIDAVQLEEGGLSHFQPAAEAGFGVEVDSPEKLFESGASCGATLRVRNNGAGPFAGAVAYEVKDYWEHVVRSGSVAVDVPAETTAAYPLDLGRLPCGYYRGYFTGPGGDVKEIIFGVYQPQPLVALPEDWPLACHNDPSPLVRKLGFGSVRAFEIFEFAGIAPEERRFDFSRCDRMVREAERCGLTVMPILGGFEWPSYRPEPPIPPYAQQQVTMSTVGGGRRLVWPTIGAWKDYVRALTSHYRGKITYWEVLNEPNLSMTPQEYLPYLQAAYEAAKEGNPDCKVVGVCATTDFAGKPGSFTGKVLELGGGAYFDVLSVHLYDTNPPERSLGAGSDQLLEGWRKTMSGTYGKEAPVWHSERSFIARQIAYSQREVNVPVEYCDEPQFLIDTFRHKAEYMIRETLLDAVAGKGGRFFWFGLFDYETCFITVRYFQPYGLDHAEFDQSPCPELIAANGLARALAGMSHPYRQIPWGDGPRCVVFAGERGSVAALWDWKGTSRVAIGVGQNPCTVLNFFGEPIPTSPGEDGEIAVELEGAPKYLSLPGQDGEAACRLLEQALPQSLRELQDVPGLAGR
ncbi:MAG: hypothetical protein AMK73_09445 [Planctomycetes bacterium SM23_32]|nr:MAG: hypothetical protein AMK73_09445 [Planctomycetes bacterium SM23_32]